MSSPIYFCPFVTLSLISVKNSFFCQAFSLVIASCRYATNEPIRMQPA